MKADGTAERQAQAVYLVWATQSSGLLLETHREPIRHKVQQTLPRDTSGTLGDYTQVTIHCSILVLEDFTGRALRVYRFHL